MKRICVNYQNITQLFVCVVQYSNNTLIDQKISIIFPHESRASVPQNSLFNNSYICSTVRTLLPSYPTYSTHNSHYYWHICLILFGVTSFSNARYQIILMDKSLLSCTNLIYFLKSLNLKLKLHYIYIFWLLCFYRFKEEIIVKQYLVKNAPYALNLITFAVPLNINKCNISNYIQLHTI